VPDDLVGLVTLTLTCPFGKRRVVTSPRASLPPIIDGVASGVGKLGGRFSRRLGELEKKRGDATADWAEMVSSRGDGSGRFPGATSRGFLVGDPKGCTALLSVAEYLLP
jgi:hypothetical protein